MKNTLKLIYRNFRKNLSTNLINLSGLTLSLTVVLMLTVYCYSELTTDQQHDKVNQTFLISKNHETTKLRIATPAVLTDHLRAEIPEIQRVIRIGGDWGHTTLKPENGSVFDIEMVFADDGFFDLFKYQVIEGSIKNALKEPMSMVLMKSEAIRLFGTTDIIGQIIKVNNEHLMKITAVIDAPMKNSFLSIKAIVPIMARPIIQPNGEEFTSWGYGNFQTFIQTRQGTNVNQLEWEIQHVFENNSSGDKSNEHSISLLPINQIYFSNIDGAIASFIKLGDHTKIAIMSLIAFIILSIALINYVNISSFSLKERLRQTGIIKIIGATKRQILINILVETMLIFFISIWLAILLSEIIQPYVFKYSGIQYNSGLLLSFQFVAIAILFSVFIGIITNLIPSIQHSVSHPINNLKREIRTSTFSKRFQGYLVIFQFCATIVLIAFTVLIQKQIHYSISGLGFNDKNIVTIRLTRELNKEVLKNELISHNNIENVSFTQYYPGGRMSNWSGVTIPIQGEDKNLAFAIFDADASFLEMTGIQLIEGRLFNDTIPSDKNKAIINRSLVEEYGIEKPLELKIPGFFGGNEGYEIIGVIEDFHFASKNQEIGPLVIKNSGGAFYCLTQLSTQDFSNLNSTLDFIKKKTAELSPDFPVEISFMDTAVEAMYQSEIQFRRSFTFFAGCAIFISCLGILALSLFTTQQRTKEIGIRKVNGAHIEDILTLLNIDLIKWVGIAFAISLPIAWFVMNKWLENFAYKTEISWWIFATGGLSALAIALLTVSWQSWKAARRNPVESLRYE